MLDLNNLYWEEKQNIDNIYRIASELWGENIKFGEIEVINSPYPEFNLPIKLYGVYDVTLEYECATIGIMIKTEQGYLGLSKMTDEQVYKGLKSCKPENLLHNFQVLDRLLSKWVASKN